MMQLQLGSSAHASLFSAIAPATWFAIKGGAVNSTVVTVAPVAGTSWYTASFTPVETGVFELVVDDKKIESFEVVSRSPFSFLQNLEDQALGGWEWNKATKVMTVYRQDGSTLGTYTSDDTLEAAYSRISI